MTFRKLPTPTDENWREILRRCDAVRTAAGEILQRDGVTRLDLNRIELTFQVPLAHPFRIYPVHVKHLVGWTFYERVEPLVWEGECESWCTGASFVLPGAGLLPEHFRNKRFRVVATEIVEGKDAEA